MKIALVRPSYDTHLVTPPLGIGYLSSYLRKHGSEVRIIDALNEDLANEEIVRLCRGAEVVGINCMSAYFAQTIELSQALKKAGKTVVLGGPHATALPEMSLREAGADFAVVGEGEITTQELVEALPRKETGHVPGVFTLTGQEFHRRELVEDLDTLPVPDWEQMDPRLCKRAPHGGLVKEFPVAPIVTTRGCPYECTFCASPVLWEKKIRFRSPEAVVDEIEYLSDKFQVREIHFEDDNLSLKRSHAEAIFEGILRRDLKICWAAPNGIRADSVDRELLRLMKRSGCYLLAFGIESGSDAILANVKKKETAGDMERAVRLAREEGIMTQGFFIFGLPGETPETIRETVRFAKRIPLDRAQFLLLDVFPGSELWRELEGQFPVEWTRASYREPVWVPEGLSKELLVQAQSRAFRSFFSRPRQFWGLLRRVRISQLPYIAKRLGDFRIIPFKIGRRSHVA